MINEWIVKNRIMRRVLVFVITFFFLKVTVNIFSCSTCLNTETVAVYGIFAGLETLILKFYLQGGKDEADND
ncbi:hypothetical protein ES703_82378 [subsurface metagenome]